MNNKRLISLTICWILVAPGLCILSFADNESGTNTEAEQHFQKANELRKLADYDAAITEYETVISLSLNSKIAQIAQYWIGQSNFRVGQFDAALSAFQKIIDEHPASTIIPSTILMMERVQQAKKNRSLFEAAEKGDIEQIELLISNGADVNAKERMSLAPLHRAAYAGHIKVVRLLIEHGADVNAEDKMKNTPLEHAAVASRTQVVKLLIEKGANLNARNEDGATPLHVAAYWADKDTVDVLIDKGASVTLRDTEGSTPLYRAMMGSHSGRREIVEIIVATGKVPSTIHLAAYMGDSAKVKTFIEEGVAVNEKGAFAVTALHCAAAGGQKEVVELLLAHGADVNARATDGMTPLQSAVYCSDDEETIKLLIANGADVNTDANVEGETGRSVLGLRLIRCIEQSLRFADEGGKSKDFRARAKSLWNSEVTQILISKGAKFGDGDKMSFTMAAVMDMPDVIELAITQSDDVNERQQNGSTFLHLAASSGQRKLVEQLFAKGADVSLKDNYGRTPLHLAAESAKEDIVKLLLAKGAKIDEKDDEYGFTALHYAARFGNKDAAEYLLTRGADINAKDNEGRTPLWWAKYRGRNETVELLRKHGAKE